MDANGLVPTETVPASRKLGRDEATALARRAKTVIVARGKKVSEFGGGRGAGDDTIDAMLGPTGNLRAPTVRAGDTVLVGFNEERYAEVFGTR